MTSTENDLKRWQIRIFWLLWSGYASYYLCRVNFAVAQPAILKEFPLWTSVQIGTIPSIYAIFYAIGQVINGTLGQKLGSRVMITFAILTASLTNLCFSFTSSYSVMLVLWAVNGYAQSAGWSLIIQTLSNWTTSKRRGTVVAFLSTCYQVGNVLSWLLAGMLVDSMGWRASFWVPSLILIPMAAAVFFFLKDHPEEVGLPHVRDDVAHTLEEKAKAAALTTSDILKLTLTNKVLWILSVGFFCMNSVRYTFMNWTVQYMADFHGRSIKGSAFIAIALPLIGSLGAISAGWASDTVFGKRRAPVCAIMLVCLASICTAFVYIPQGQWLWATVLLGLAGFMMYGPDMLMSGAATIDVSHPKAASIATGLTMCLGASGAIFSGAGIGWLKDAAAGQWSLIFFVLTGLSIVSALLMVLIWNAKPKGAK